MRTVTYGAACSLDGFIAGKNGEIDWLHFSPDVTAIMNKYWASFDTILMGRKTWDAAAAMSKGANPYGSMPTYVFSRTLKSSPNPGVELMSGDAAGFVNALKRKKGKGICVMGGGDFARSLFEGGAIDEVGLNIHPVLLGAGAPLFLDAGRRIKLELLESRVLHGGCVLANYRVKRGRAPNRLDKAP